MVLELDAVRRMLDPVTVLPVATADFFGCYRDGKRRMLSLLDWKKAIGLEILEELNISGPILFRNISDIPSEVMAGISLTRIVKAADYPGGHDIYMDRTELSRENVMLVVFSIDSEGVIDGRLTFQRPVDGLLFRS